MQRIALLLVLFCFGITNAQVQKLAELSSGMFIDSAVIMEQDESDVYGYCLLYELDRKSKEVFELEYVILDKNLNKLTSITLTQAIFKTWMAKTTAELTFVKKIGNQLTIAVNDRIANMNSYSALPFFNYRFIQLNLDNFTFSKEFKYENFTKSELEYKSGDKVSFDDIWNLQKLIKTNGNYILSFGSPEYNPKAAVSSNVMNLEYKKYKSIKKFALLDKDMSIVWSKDINGNDKEACRYEYLDSDNDILLLKKEELIKKEYYVIKGIEAYDMNTGKLIGEMKVEDEKYDITLYSVDIVKDRIHVFANAYEKSKSARSLGYAHIVFDKSSAAETGRSFMLWKNMGSVVPAISEYGRIGKDDRILAQDFVINSKGNTVAIFEAYDTKDKYDPLNGTQKMYVLLKDMYIVEADASGAIVFSKKIEKTNSVLAPAGLHALQLKKYGVYDYIFCQKINKSGDFVLFYTLNDQEGSRKKVAKKPLWTLGMISNVGGDYGFEALPLYGDDLKIYPGLAKNGYIRLLEVNQKTNQAEMRLEKINY